MRFSIPVGLRKTVLLSCALLFLVVGSFIMLKSARDALFLNQYSYRNLPYFMALNTVVSAIAATLYLRLYRKFGLKRIIWLFFTLFSAGTLLFWVRFSAERNALPAYLYLWVGVIGTIAPVQAWSVISRIYSTREARSVLGFVSASATVGAVAGGFLSTWLAQRFGVSSLIPVAAASIFLALFAATKLSSTAQSEEAPKASQIQQRPVRRRFVILLLAIVSIGTIVSTFIDYQFKTLAQSQLDSAKTMASFFGSFYGLLGIATLILQIIGLPIILRRFRISASLAILPFSLLLVNGVFFFTGLFIAAVVLRGMEEIFKHSVDRSSLEVLYVALPDHTKVQLKGMIDTLGVRVPECIASISLMALFTWGHLPIATLIYLNGAFILLWLCCAFLLGRKEYPILLKDGIQHGEMDLESVRQDLFSGPLHLLLPGLVSNADKEIVLNLLDLLERSHNRWLGRYLVEALERKEPEIRLKALMLLFGQDANVSFYVRRLLHDPVREIRREAIHYLCARTARIRKLLRKIDNDSDPAMQAAAAAARLRRKREREKAYALLDRLLTESQRNHRPDVGQEIAHILEHSTPDVRTESLYKRLLRDPEPAVRQAALQSLSVTKLPGLIPHLIGAMRRPGLRQEAGTTLAAYGKVLMPHLARLIADENETITLRKSAVRIAADIGGLQSIDLIVHAAQMKNTAIRYSAIKALNQLRRRHPLTDFHPVLRAILHEEIEQLKLALERRLEFAAQPDRLINRVSSQEIKWGLERVFRLLALLFESDLVYYAYLGWIGEDPRRKDTAMELLENTVSVELSTQILPLIELFRADVDIPDPAKREKAFFSYIRENNPLLVAAAIHDLSPSEFASWTPQLKDSLKEPPPPLVEEMLQWRLNKMENSKEKTPFTTIEKMELLGKQKMFSKLGSQELLMLANVSEEVRAQAGEFLFKEGEASDEGVCLVEGRVEITKAGKRISVIGPGESVGMHGMLTGSLSLFSAQAQKPCHCLRIHREKFWEILEDNTSVCHAMIEVLVQQIDELTEKLASVDALEKV